MDGWMDEGSKEVSSFFPPFKCHRDNDVLSVHQLNGQTLQSSDDASISSGAAQLSWKEEMGMSASQEKEVSRERHWDKTQSRAERVRDAPEVSSWHASCHVCQRGEEGGQQHFCHLEVLQDGGHSLGKGSLPPGIPGGKDKPWRPGSVVLLLAIFMHCIKTLLLFVEHCRSWLACAVSNEVSLRNENQHRHRQLVTVWS